MGTAVDSVGAAVCWLLLEEASVLLLELGRPGEGFGRASAVSG